MKWCRDQAKLGQKEGKNGQLENHSEAEQHPRGEG